jgi:hypothetical protein
VTISYRLNQAATLGVMVAILQGTNQVATISGGTNRGLNTVVWGGTNNSGATVGAGTYSLNITTASSGFTNWEVISVDANAGNYAYYVSGLAVDNNTNSPYYGRVVLGCQPIGCLVTPGAILFQALHHDPIQIALKLAHQLGRVAGSAAGRQPAGGAKNGRFAL